MSRTRNKKKRQKLKLRIKELRTRLACCLFDKQSEVRNSIEKISEIQEDIITSLIGSCDEDDDLKEKHSRVLDFFLTVSALIGEEFIQENVEKLEKIVPPDGLDRSIERTDKFISFIRYTYLLKSEEIFSQFITASGIEGMEEIIILLKNNKFLYHCFVLYSHGIKMDEEAPDQLIDKRFNGFIHELYKGELKGGTINTVLIPQFIDTSTPKQTIVKPSLVTLSQTSLPLSRPPKRPSRPPKRPSRPPKRKLSKRPQKAPPKPQPAKNSLLKWADEMKSNDILRKVSDDDSEEDDSEEEEEAPRPQKNNSTSSSSPIASQSMIMSQNVSLKKLKEMEKEMKLRAEKLKQVEKKLKEREEELKGKEESLHSFEEEMNSEKSKNLLSEEEIQKRIQEEVKNARKEMKKFRNRKQTKQKLLNGGGDEEEDDDDDEEEDEEEDDDDDDKNTKKKNKKEKKKNKKKKKKVRIRRIKIVRVKKKKGKKGTSGGVRKSASVTTPLGLKSKTAGTIFERIRKEDRGGKAVSLSLRLPESVKKKIKEKDEAEKEGDDSDDDSDGDETEDDDDDDDEEEEEEEGEEGEGEEQGGYPRKMIEIASEFVELDAHFESLDRKHFKISRRNENKIKNRYTNILPYDHNVVLIKGKRYLNASECMVNGIPYLCSQWPLKRGNYSGDYDFWSMIFYNEARVIVILQKPNPPKHHFYFPHVSGDTMKLTNYKLTCTSYVKGEHFDTYNVKVNKHRLITSFKNRFKSIVSGGGGGGKRKSKKITKKEEEEEEDAEKQQQQQTSSSQFTTLKEHHCVFLVYKKWPDHSIPSDFESLEQLLIKADQLNIETKRTSILGQEKPMVVHCSAGIGRTGVFMVAHNLMRHRWGVEKVRDTLFAMRKQRKGMVQTIMQYKYIFDYVWWKTEGRKEKKKKEKKEKKENETLKKVVGMWKSKVKKKKLKKKKKKN